MKYLSVIFTILLLFAPLKANKIQNVTLQLKWKHQFQFAGYYAAIEKGYYKELGINVDLKEAVEGKNPSNEVIEGKAEFGVCNSDVLIMRSQNKKAVVLATVYQHSPLILLASKNSGIEHVQDLIGKRIALEPNEADVVAYMHDEGVPLNKCKIEYHTFNTDKLINGEIDAISAYTTDELYSMQKAKFDYTIIDPSMGGIDFYGDVLFTTEGLIKSNPELVEKFRRASLKGWKYAMDNPEEIIQLIYNKYTQRHSIEHLRFEAAKMKNLIMADVVEMGYTNPGRWESISNTYKTLKMLDESFTTKGLLYSEYTEPEIAIEWDLIAILSIIIVIIAIIAFILHRSSKKLRKEIENRQKIEIELRESEQRYRVVVDNLQEGMAVAQDTHLKFVNPMLLQITERTEDELLGMPFLELVHPDDREMVANSYMKRVNGNALADRYYVRMLKKDGKLKWLELSGVKIDWEGKPATLNILTDVTEQKNTEEALKEMNAYLESLLNFANAPIIVWDPHFHITRFNHAFEFLTGLTESEAIGNTLHILFPPEQAENSIAKIQKTLTDGSRESVEIEILHKNQSIRTLLWNSATLLASDGHTPTATIAQGQDITDRKRAEEAVRESEEKFSKIGNSALDGVIMINDKGRIEFWNPAAEKIFGYSKEEVIDRILHSLLTPDEHLPAHYKGWESFIETGQGNAIGKVVELSGKRKNGEIFPVELALTSVEIENSHWALGYVRDITERKKAEEALRESEEKFRNVFEYSLVGKSMTTLDGKLTTNKAFVEMLGYTEEELSQLKWQDITQPDSLENDQKVFNSILAGEYLSKRWEKRYIHKNGNIVWVDISTTLHCDMNGKPLYFITAINNITRSKLAEEEIKRKNEELQKLNAEKDKFFSIISHDLRSPFTSFLGLTQLMVDDLDTLTMPEILKMSVTLSNSATNLFRLLENLLEWSQMKQGLIPFDPEIIKLYPVAHESILMILEPAKTKGIEINNDITKEMEVFADSNILQTIIRNLVSNAVKFTDKGGNITLSAKNNDGHTVEVSVKDTGIGMDNELLGNLFRIDVQTNRRGTEGEPSTGLGLILCKDFVEKHGGTLWAESEEGKGSTFYFTMPTSIRE
ncbi:MAG: PAS domain S-box protein [bacterium]